MVDEVYWQIGMTLADSEKKIILKCLKFNQGNQSKTAQMLGVSVRTIFNKLKEYGIDAGSPPPPEDKSGKKK